MSRVAAAKHQQYAEERRELILDAALQVFANATFADAKMDDVAAAAGLSKGALYLYFPTKEALLQSLIKRYALLPELPELMDSIRESPPSVGIPSLIGEIWSRLCERKALAQVIVREIQSNPARAKLFSEQVGLRAYHALASYLEHWMKRGELRHQDAFAAAQCLFGMLWFFLTSQELTGGKELHPLSDDTIVSTVARMFLEGAVSNKKRSPSHRPAASQCARRS
ncbi:MAG TPA: TetR/AcrR family transcriptional regulator [Candidatus Binataceae bacterium]|nr:TetR/AcrR family transcriptional regulator [Candidatus Binataceae bacterium]